MDAEQYAMLRERLDSLPKLDKKIFTLRILHGYTQEEVAEKLGLTQSAVSRIENRFGSDDK